MEEGSYRITPYDAEWPKFAQEEMALVAKTLSLTAERLEHIGSTAIKGLAAKPIIDLMAGIDDSPLATTAKPIIEQLRGVGYEIGGDETVPGTLYCRKALPRRFNLHLTQYGARFWKSHLAFRDFLRVHPEIAAEYEALKNSILKSMGKDLSQKAYNEAKTSFIQAVTARAETEGYPLNAQ